MLKTKMLGLLLMSSLSLPAATIYNESTFTDFSSSGSSPTALTLFPGSNQILGTNGSQADSVRDYVTITIPTGFMLSSLTLLDTALGAKGFLGVEAGNQLTLLPSTTTAAGLLGWWHYTPSDINSDLLALMATPANGSSGFAPPLSAGTYALWIQDSSTGLFHYGFDLEVQAAPEPSTWLACLAGVGLLLGIRRKMRNASAN